MQSIEISISESIFSKAQRFSDFRDKCKNYLTKAGKNWDKFTVVSHDSIIGYLTEHSLIEVLKTKIEGVQVETWEQQFDINELIRIVDTEDFSEQCINLVVEYFYDKWDLKLSKKSQVIYCDVKTALTKKEPALSWNFLYPVVQATKPGKDITSLVYYVVGDLKNIKSLKKLVLIGFTDYEKVQKCKIIRAGDITRFGTISQIDNYITELGRDYSLNFNHLFK